MSDQINTGAGPWWEMLFLRPLRGWRGWTVYAVLLGLLGVVYFGLGSVMLTTINQDLEGFDQGANIQLARASANDWYPHRSTYIQPLWPWVSRVVMVENDEEFFVRGKWLNLSLGYGVTVLLAVLAGWWMAPVPGFTVGLLAGIGVMLQRAHFFHPEPLLYTFFAAAIVFMALSLWQSRWFYYVAWGFSLGLAYLAKSSTTPLLAVYAGATVVLLIARAGWWPRWLCGRSVSADWSLWRHTAGTLLSLACFAAVIMPNAVFKQQNHGDPLWNIARYWMWCDDWDTEAAPLYPLVATPEARAKFVPGELPTGANYLRRHGFTHAWERWTDGVSFMTERFVIPVRSANRALFFKQHSGNEARAEAPKVWRYFLSARGLYLSWFLGLVVLLLVVRTYREGWPVFRSPPALAVTALLAALTLGYLAAFGWYAAIGRGERFTLMLYLPLLLFLNWGCWAMAQSTASPWMRLFYAAGLTAVLAHALVQSALLLAYPHFGQSL